MDGGKPIDRRAFLTAAGAGILMALTPDARAENRSDVLFASAGKRPDGSFAAILFDETGTERFSLPLPDRGHDIALDPERKRAVAFARRPGNFAVAFDTDGSGEPQFFSSTEGRHFYGHGVFSRDGKLLYTSENDYEAATGAIGIYDASDSFRRIGEFPSYGTGPHEILLMPDGNTLAVANGGIETHPDFGRTKLNLATMEPSLAFIDSRTGALKEQHRLDPGLHQLSIRHMDRDGKGRIFFGCQYEGSAVDLPPLVGSVREGDAVTLLDLDADQLGRFRNYIGSVKVASNDDAFAVTSPKGHCAALFDAASGKLLQCLRRRDVCGLAPDGIDFLLAADDGLGHLERSPEEIHPLGFFPDNHMRPIG